LNSVGEQFGALEWWGHGQQLARREHCEERVVTKEHIRKIHSTTNLHLLKGKEDTSKEDSEERKK